MKIDLRDNQTNLNIEIYLKSWLEINDNDYIIQYQQKLLPDWKFKPQTIIFVFFQCYCVLDGSRLKLEQIEKDRLLEKFNRFSRNFYLACQQHNWLTEVICPKDGTPKYSQKGEQIFSIQSIVTRNFQSFQKVSRGCGLIHSNWGKAVYPCLILSVASKPEIQSILKDVTRKENWSPKSLEYLHHNFLQT